MTIRRTAMSKLTHYNTDPNLPCVRADDLSLVYNNREWCTVGGNVEKLRVTWFSFEIDRKLQNSILLI